MPFTCVMSFLIPLKTVLALGPHLLFVLFQEFPIWYPFGFFSNPLSLFFFKSNFNMTELPLKTVYPFFSTKSWPFHWLLSYFPSLIYTINISHLNEQHPIHASDCHAVSSLLSTSSLACWVSKHPHINNPLFPNLPKSSHHTLWFSKII